MGEPKTKNLFRLFRFLAISALAFVIVGGPILRQGLNMGSRHLPSWQMFSGIGLGLIRVEFLQAKATGLESIDRITVLQSPPKRERFIRTKQVWDVARRLCTALGRDADVGFAPQWPPATAGNHNSTAN